MEPLESFVDRFNTRIHLDKNLVLEKMTRYFLLNEKLKPLVQKDFYYAGVYLGKVKNGIFFPSFILLSMIAEEEANKTTVDDKTAWLFVCGRDVFKRGIKSVSGSRRKGDYTLVMNRHGECLGFGKILFDIDGEKDGNKVIVKNVSDIGDFLRREK
jgi:ribosome biogenesis protein Nip4